MFRRCTSMEIVPLHVVQIEPPIMQEEKQLQEYNTPNNQVRNQQYNSRPNDQNWQNNQNNWYNQRGYNQNNRF